MHSSCAHCGEPLLRHEVICPRCHRETAVGAHHRAIGRWFGPVALWALIMAGVLAVALWGR